MDTALELKREQFNRDYNTESGKTALRFYCPILMKDENVELCKAHIVNRAFSDKPNAWTVQRKDVDNFYGSMFEADFLDIDAFEEAEPLKILFDKKRSKRFAAKLFLEGEPVDHFFSDSTVPKEFTKLQFVNLDSSPSLGVKMTFADIAEAQGKNWEVEIVRDIRIPTLVSVIKAAHLTLFELLGYRHVLRLAGYFTGRQILGNFFLENQGKSKKDVLAAAHPFFREFVHMVRPLILHPEFKGSITDKTFYMCVGSSGVIWGIIVFVKTAHMLHAVLTPIFETAEQSVTFLDFLRNQNSWIQVAPCQFEEDQWKISKETRPIYWPKEGVLYPE